MSRQADPSPPAPASDRSPERPDGDSAPGRRRGTGVRRGIALLVVLLAWLAVAGAGGPLVGRLSEVQKNDNAAFLPDQAESTRAAELASGFSDDDTLPYFLVAERDGGLDPQDLPTVQAFVEGVADLRIEMSDGSDEPLVGDFLADQPVVVVPSEDGQALFVPIALDSEKSAANLPDGESVVFGVATAIREAVADDLTGDGLEVYLAGPGGILADLVTAFQGIDGRLLQITLSVVFVILLLVYRSPILPFAALLSSLFALAGAGGVVYALADNEVIDLNGQSQGILFILVVGAATDYALLLVARYREELHDHESKYDAMRRAWRATVEPVAASGATVMLGLLCLLLADLGSTRGLGPVGAIGIAASMLSVLTFLPVLLLWPVIVLLLVLGGVVVAAGAVAAGATGALVAAAVVVVVAAVLAVLRWRALSAAGAAGERSGHPLPLYARAPSGRWLFWPRVPRIDHVHAADAVGGKGLWGRVARLVGDHPRAVWVVTLACLLALAAFVPTFKASGQSQTDVFRDRTEAVAGQEVLAEHFPGGAGSPALVIAPADAADDVLRVAQETDGIDSATFTTDGPPGPPGAPGEARVVDDRVQVQAVLRDDAGSPAAEDVVADLRERLDEVTDDALVGGSTASNLDVREASGRDLRLIVPTILVVILVVLMLLLRSVVAPVLLIVANVVSFGTAIGTAALVFNHVLDLPGGDPAIPLYGFVFLVALGIDYSIFLMTRVREESGRRGTRPGILVGLAVTGGVITSAGIVLAATFSALVTLPLVFLLQLAFIVAFGVLVDTFVVRSLLVPALAYDIGPRIWWPSPLARAPQPAAGQDQPADDPAPQRVP